MKSIRETLRSLGFELKDRYLIYKTEERIIAVPYMHIKTLELKGTKVILMTGGIERVVLDMPSESIALGLFEEILLHLERLHL